MKYKSKTLLAALATGLLSFGLMSQQASAVQVSGNITFNGTVNLNTPSAGTATAVTAWYGNGGVGLPYVSDRDGDFATFVALNAGVAITAPWSFNSLAVPSFWSVGGFTFDLTQSSVVSQSAGTVTVSGSGIISGNMFSSTPGVWNFSTQDPSSGSPARFSFSAASGSVPDGGMTVALLGLAMVGLVGLRKKLAVA